MDDGKHHVVENYPAENLPDELRGPIDASETVTVEVFVSRRPSRTFTDIFDQLHEARVESDDPVMRIRALREEWEDRDRYQRTIARGGSS